MKRAIKIALLTFGAFAIGAGITVDGILASGRVHDVSTAGIPAASCGYSRPSQSRPTKSNAAVPCLLIV